MVEGVRRGGMWVSRGEAVSDEDYYTIQEMRRMGGRFVEALGDAAMVADEVNFDRLKRAFPEIFEKYRGMK